VLRVNPNNSEAAGALHRLRGPEMLFERQRNRLRFYRDLAMGAMWILILALLYTMLISFMNSTT
jgi:hypothetical protein